MDESRGAGCGLVVIGLLAGLAGGSACSLVNDPGRHQNGDGSASPDGGDPDVGDAGGLEPIPADQICAALAELTCDARAECCPIQDGEDGGVSDCRTAARQACEDELKPLFEDSRTGYSATRAAEVVRRGRELSATCSTDVVEWYVYDLVSVMRGTAARQQSCAPRERDDPATFFSCDLDQELVCRPSDTGWACQGISTEGGRCAILYHCERGLYCDISLFAAVCEPQRGNGMSCTDAVQCRSLYCADGVCEPPDSSVYCASLDTFYGE